MTVICTIKGVPWRCCHYLGESTSILVDVAGGELGAGTGAVVAFAGVDAAEEAFAGVDLAGDGAEGVTAAVDFFPTSCAVGVAPTGTVAFALVEGFAVTFAVVAVALTAAADVVLGAETFAVVSLVAVALAVTLAVGEVGVPVEAVDALAPLCLGVEVEEAGEVT